MPPFRLARGYPIPLTEVSCIWLLWHCQKTTTRKQNGLISDYRTTIGTTGQSGVTLRPSFLPFGQHHFPAPPVVVPWLRKSERENNKNTRPVSRITHRDKPRPNQSEYFWGFPNHLYVSWAAIVRGFCVERFPFRRRRRRSELVRERYALVEYDDGRGSTK